MDIKVNQVNQTQQVTQTQHVQESDGSFKFMLASNIEEAELAGRLNTLMEQIDSEGKKLAHAAVPARELLQPQMRPALPHEAVPAAVPVLPAELLHQRRGVQDLIDSFALESQPFRNLPCPDTVCLTDYRAHGTLQILPCHRAVMTLNES